MTGGDPITRRRVLAGGGLVAGAGLAGVCAVRLTKRTAAGGGGAVGPGSPEVAAAEARRRGQNARVVTASVAARAGPVDLGGPVVSTWAYGGAVPGPLLRVSAGDVLQVAVRSELPADTSVHWHGVAVRNDVDGVPGLTQQPIRPNTTMTYQFTVPHPGTYWFHPHVGTQLDRGLYAPLLVDDPDEPGRYDAEFTVVLDDWLDGTGRDPDRVLAELTATSGMGGGMSGMGGMDGMDGMDGMGHGSTPGTGPAWSDALGGGAGDVAYPYYLANGRVPASPVSFRGRPRQRLRLRLVNAAADTAFRVALGGHRLTVTHTDGYPVRPVLADAVLLGMGERYDAEVTLGDGVFPLVAAAEGKQGQALALVRTGGGRPPAPTVRPAELDGPLLGLADLRATPPAALPDRAPTAATTCCSAAA